MEKVETYFRWEMLKERVGWVLSRMGKVLLKEGRKNGGDFGNKNI